jgi:hypothetical protein
MDRLQHGLYGFSRSRPLSCRNLPSDGWSRKSPRPPREQRTFLIRLPQLFDFSPSDMGLDLLKAAESSFAFWDNPDDSNDVTL